MHLLGTWGNKQNVCQQRHRSTVSNIFRVHERIIRDDIPLKETNNKLSFLKKSTTDYSGLVVTVPVQFHQVRNALFKALDLNGVNPTTLAHNNATNIALDLYQVNFKSMWAKNKIINYPLDKVMLVQLRAHLASKKEMQRRQNMMELSARPPTEKKIGKNYEQNILRVERKKLLKYQTKDIYIRHSY